MFVSQLFWNKEKFLEQVDGKGAHLKNKTTTLEMIGVLLPSVQVPEILKNQHIVLRVYNISCFSGWENRNCKLHTVTIYFDKHMHIIDTSIYMLLDNTDWII